MLDRSQNNTALSLRKTHRRLSHIEAIAIHQLLAQHLQPKNDDGICVYNEGWNDQRIALEVAKDLTEKHVGPLRLQMFGPIAMRTGATVEDASLRDSHDKLVGLVTASISQQNAFMALVADLCDKHNRLCTLVSMGHAKVDARNLAVVTPTRVDDLKFDFNE